MVKNIEFIEKKNKPLFEVECVMEDIFDIIYERTQEYYIQNNISDIILIDHRLDIWRNKLINCTYLKDEDEIGVNKYIYAFNKKNFYINYGILFKIIDNIFYIKGKKSCYKIDKTKFNIFYIQLKSNKEKNNDNIRNILENILNNKIKIKKKT
tara:strand:+ start:5611 stop:6069 length:459 start_codon:yes stop_codon:yes gene_type:complete